MFWIIKLQIALTLLFLSNTSFSDDLLLKCESVFQEFSVIQEKDSFFLNGVRYPDYTEKINSVGKIWAKVRTAKLDDKNLELIQITKHAKGEWVSKKEFFTIKIKDMTFVRGVDGLGRQRLKERLADWLRSSSGNCKKIIENPQT